MAWVCVDVDRGVQLLKEWSSGIFTVIMVAVFALRARVRATMRQTIAAVVSMAAKANGDPRPGIGGPFPHALAEQYLGGTGVFYPERWAPDFPRRLRPPRLDTWEEALALCPQRGPVQGSLQWQLARAETDEDGLSRVLSI